MNEIYNIFYILPYSHHYYEEDGNRYYGNIIISDSLKTIIKYHSDEGEDTEIIRSAVREFLTGNEISCDDLFCNALKKIRKEYGNIEAGSFKEALIDYSKRVANKLDDRDYALKLVNSYLSEKNPIASFFKMLIISDAVIEAIKLNKKFSDITFSPMDIDEYFNELSMIRNRNIYVSQINFLKELFASILKQEIDCESITRTIVRGIVYIPFVKFGDGYVIVINTDNEGLIDDWYKRTSRMEGAIKKYVCGVLNSITDNMTSHQYMEVISENFKNSLLPEIENIAVNVHARNIVFPNAISTAFVKIITSISTSALISGDNEPKIAYFDMNTSGVYLIYHWMRLLSYSSYVMNYDKQPEIVDSIARNIPMHLPIPQFNTGKFASWVTAENLLLKDIKISSEYLNMNDIPDYHLRMVSYDMNTQKLIDKLYEKYPESLVESDEVKRANEIYWSWKP